MKLSYEIWLQKTRVSVLSDGEKGTILRSVVAMQYRRTPLVAITRDSYTVARERGSHDTNAGEICFDALFIQRNKTLHTYT